MSNINKQALREVAKQCSAQEPLRIVEYHGKMCLRNSGGIVFTVLRDSSFPEYSSENENYARLAELSTPDTMLALLDELQAAEKSNAFLKGQLAELANFNPDWDKLEAATDSLREHMSELTAARARIAELEAREVVLPRSFNREIFGEGMYEVPNGNWMHRKDVTEALVAAGIITKVGE